MTITALPQSVNSLAEFDIALSQASEISAIVTLASLAARRLTGADGASIVLREGEHCCYVEENAIEPLWKGRRFPLSACISGWAMCNNTQVVIDDIYRDARIPADVYRPTFVRSLAMAPVGRNQMPIGSIGSYWGRLHHPGSDEVAVQQGVADRMFAAIAKLGGSHRAALLKLTEVTN